MNLRVASVLEPRFECSRLTDEYTKRGRTRIKNAKGWNGQNDGNREKKDYVIYPHLPEDDEDRDVIEPVVKAQLIRNKHNMSDTRINIYRGRPCLGFVDVVARRVHLDG